MFFFPVLVQNLKLKSSWNPVDLLQGPLLLAERYLINLSRYYLLYPSISILAYLSIYLDIILSLYLSIYLPIPLSQVFFFSSLLLSSLELSDKTIYDP